VIMSVILTTIYIDSNHTVTACICVPLTLS
jgi:hypothetical protein